jgi:hypothetical protein
MLRVLCTVALLAGCKSDGASPPSPSTGPAPASSPTPDEPGATAQPGTSVRSARVAVDVPTREAGSGSASGDPSAQRRAPGWSSADRRKRLESVHAGLDADHDGVVSLDELRRSQLGRFDPAAVDTDRDGVISLDELDVALAKAMRTPSR